MVVRAVTRPVVRAVTRPVVGGLGAIGETDPLLALFASGEQGVYLDYSNPDMLFTDTTRTTSASENETAAGVTDQSGNNNHGVIADVAK